ncbi:DoxX family protein [Massilia pinisoli]|uniref:DoxX family protein n=1 Tax=Massilia pinisoli TaxID=1772194 RepID=A0ABT1ZZ28_9BURK|nr:DoxX family protein [Massilia pinisoli]MCS0585134.1 DoxX family protein [Massilia pinisoli]
METTKLFPVARALVGVLFLASGINKILGFGYVAGWMNSLGFPAAGLLLAGAIVLEIVGGLALVTGFQAKTAALALALFTVPVTLIFHGFWHVDAAEFQNQLNHFLKNVAIFGGLLALFDAERQRDRITARVDVLRGRTA